VKFNRKGVAAFRVVSMASATVATMLSWRPAERQRLGAKLLRLGAGKAEGIDLRRLKVGSEDRAKLSV
jgi:hypothetical protein